MKFNILLFFIGLIFFGYRLNLPNQIYYDEFHYIPAAVQFVHPEGMTKAINLEHPPLAKLIIATGIYFFGNNPIGWRIMSVLFGALLLVVLYNWGLDLFKSKKWALCLVLLTMCNQVLFVQSRIAMLDTFMAVFLMASLYFFYKGSLQTNWNKKYIFFSAVLIGFATACKLSAIVAGVVYLIWFIINFYKNKKFDWAIFCILALVPILSYIACYIPYSFYKEFNLPLSEFINQQKYMWNFHKNLNMGHTYQSAWDTWALMKRPMWYFYEKNQEGTYFSGVIMLGNPFLMWTGYAAFLYLIYDWFKNKSQDILFVLCVFATLYLSWALIPRKVNFYYYYYPASLILPLLSIFIMQKINQTKYRYLSHVYILVCVLVFVFFYPIISATDSPAVHFNKWMWLKSWI